MTCQGVGHLVSDDCGQTGFIPGDGQDARVDPDLAARQAEGIGLRAVEKHEFPLCIGQVGHGGDPATHLFEQRLLGGVLADGCFFLERVEGAEPQGDFLAGPGDHELLSPGHRLGDAAGSDESHAQEQALVGLQARRFHGLRENHKMASGTRRTGSRMGCIGVILV